MKRKATNLKEVFMTVVPYLIMFVMAVQIGVLVSKSNEKDRQIQVLARNQGTLIRTQKALVLRIGELQARLDASENRVQRLDMLASWYGPGFHGKTTASGTTYNQMAYTVAHKTLPFGTVLVIEYKGRRVIGIVTDRGPYKYDRELDLSLGIANELRFTKRGVDNVIVYKVEVS